MRLLFFILRLRFCTLNSVCHFGSFFLNIVSWFCLNLTIMNFFRIPAIELDFKIYSTMSQRWWRISRFIFADTNKCNAKNRLFNNIVYMFQVYARYKLIKPRKHFILKGLCFKFFSHTWKYLLRFQNVHIFSETLCTMVVINIKFSQQGFRILFIIITNYILQYQFLNTITHNWYVWSYILNLCVHNTLKVNWTSLE